MREIRSDPTSIEVVETGRANEVDFAAGDADTFGLLVELRVVLRGDEDDRNVRFLDEDCIS